MSSANDSQASDGKFVLYAKHENYAVITINRPDVLNAINSATTEQLLSAFTDADEDDDVRAVILNGAGRAFSAPWGSGRCRGGALPRCSRGRFRTPAAGR